MMYKKNFVAAIKLGGKVLRESNDRVELPFGSEYSILLKNLDSVRVRASIQIDGSDAVEGLVIQPNSEIEIERFLRKSGSLDQGNRFKFIERTAKIEDHRGIKADDGLVRIEFEREKVFNPPVTTVVHHHYKYGGPSWPIYSGYQGQMVNSSRHMTGSLRRGGITGQSVTGTVDSDVDKAFKFLNTSNTSSSAGVASVLNSQAILYDKDLTPNLASSVSAAVMATPFTWKWEPENEAGITVEGSVSSQKFVPVQGFECEAPDVVVLHLVGRKQGTAVKVAKTVRAKVVCTTCGTKNKSSVKFCKECGTSLEKV